MASTSFEPSTPNSLINGLASGDTTQNSTVLWARSTFTGPVTFEYSTDPNLATPVGTATATVTDVNVPVKVEIEGLDAGTEYFYRVTDAAGATAAGKFKTSAELGQQTGLRFGVSGDWRGELSPYPALGNASERDLAFFVEHGDTIHADFPSRAVLNPDGTRKAQAETLDEYRAKQSEVYGTRLGANIWAKLRASTSILATIDDHEVIDNFSGGAPAASDPRFGTTEGLINDTELYENGLQAFQEYNPLRDEFYGETGDERTEEERQLYRFNTYGSDAATFVLDARSFRDEPLVPADLNDPADVGRFLSQSLTLERTLLGAPQLEDLKQDLLAAENSGITWKFVLLPEPIQNLGPGAAEDRYEGYAKERTEILSFINENNIDNVVFVAADLHGTVVNNLTYQEEPGGAQIATNAFEITTGSVASDPPFGPEVISLAAELGFLTPKQQAFYNWLPVANDPDSIVNDKDDFLKQLINENLEPFGYDPVGLNNNLALADSSLDATLLQGDYIATHTFGWTEFDIDPVTEQLRVTTYGIEPYSEAELFAHPEAVLSRTPEVVSEFTVNPLREDEVIKLEAENLDLDTYLVEDWSVASNGQALSLLGGGDAGTASTRFTGPSGIYTVVVGYYDEIDGESLFRLRVNDDIVDNWRADQELDPRGFVPTENNFTRRTIGGIELQTGDVLAIEGFRDAKEYARVDFLQLIPSTVNEPSSQPDELGMVTVGMNLTEADGIGKEIGTIEVEDTEFGLLLTPDLSGLTPGVHGFHVHSNPDCGPGERDGQAVPGLAAGGHYDPENTGKHEGPYGDGHLGDLPPLIVDADGTATLPVLAPRLEVSALTGRSLMLHQGGDNFSDTPLPLGGGGARIACGVV